MDKAPKIKEVIGGYELLWTDINIMVCVTKIKQHRDNRITGWIRIIQTINGTNILLHQADLNFASTQTQRGLANSLTERYETSKEEKQQINWHDIIEQVRYYILEIVREGEPVLTWMSDEEGAVPPRFLVHPIMPQGEPTIIYGDPGCGKSSTAQIVYMCLQVPWRNNPLGFMVPEEPVITLYLDWESNPDRIKWRFKKYQQGMGIPPFPIHYRRCYLPLPDDIEQIKVKMNEVGAQAIVIDSLAQAAGGKFLEGDVATNFFQGLGQLKTSAFIIGQNQKDPDNKTKSILGSGIYQYYSRSIWEARKSQDPGENELHVALYHRKANETMLFRPISFRLYFNEEKTIIYNERTRDVPEFRANMKTRDRVLIAVQELGRASKSEIAEDAGITESQAGPALSRLKMEGKVINFREDNTWGAIDENIGKENL